MSRATHETGSHPGRGSGYMPEAEIALIHLVQADRTRILSEGYKKLSGALKRHNAELYLEAQRREESGGLDGYRESLNARLAEIKSSGRRLKRRLRGDSSESERASFDELEAEKHRLLKERASLEPVSSFAMPSVFLTPEGDLRVRIAQFKGDDVADLHDKHFLLALSVGTRTATGTYLAAAVERLNRAQPITPIEMMLTGWLQGLSAAVVVASHVGPLSDADIEALCNRFDDLDGFHTTENSLLLSQMSKNFPCTKVDFKIPVLGDAPEREVQIYREALSCLEASEVFQASLTEAADAMLASLAERGELGSHPTGLEQSRVLIKRYLVTEAAQAICYDQAVSRTTPTVHGYTGKVTCQGLMQKALAAYLGRALPRRLSGFTNFDFLYRDLSFVELRCLVDSGLMEMLIERRLVSGTYLEGMAKRYGMEEELEGSLRCVASVGHCGPDGQLLCSLVPDLPPTQKFRHQLMGRLTASTPDVRTTLSEVVHLDFASSEICVVGSPPGGGGGGEGGSDESVVARPLSAPARSGLFSALPSSPSYAGGRCLETVRDVSCHPSSADSSEIRAHA